MPAVADQTHKPPTWHLMHYNPNIKGVWSGYGGDLKPLCGQSEQIMVTGVAEAVDCQKCAHILERQDS